LALDHDGDTLAWLQLCERRGEHARRRDLLAVDGHDRVSGAYPCFRSRPAGFDRADEDAVPARVAHTHTEVGAVRVDDLAVGDDLAGDVLDEVARKRKADAGRAAAAELRIDCS